MPLQTSRFPVLAVWHTALFPDGLLSFLVIQCNISSDFSHYFSQAAPSAWSLQHLPLSNSASLEILPQIIAFLKGIINGDKKNWGLRAFPFDSPWEAQAQQQDVSVCSFDSHVEQ